MLDLLKVSALIKNSKIINNFVDVLDGFWLQILQAKKVDHNLTWLGNINDFYHFLNCDSDYSLLAVDGSQIYPDRHEGIEAFLINIGVVEINYQKALINCWTVPYIFSNIKELKINTQNETNQIIDHYRSYLELQQAKDNFNNHDFIILDGNYPELDQDNSQIMQNFCAEQIPVFFYVSLSNSRDLLKLVDCKLPILDRELLEKYLPSLHYTTVFVQKKLCNNLDMAFIYLNTGEEIVRIEFSCWLQDKIHYYLKYIFDQIKKGAGYPVVLAEAHMQAVISNQDRFYFYKLIRLYHDTPNRSFKLQRKRLIAS